jgi:hypothetical protein
MPIKDEIIKRKKQIWIVLIFLILLIIAAIIYLMLVFFKGPEIANVNENLNQIPMPAPQIITPSTFNVGNSRVLADVQALSNIPISNEADKQNILFIASSFAERFGSYSNQSDYRNFEELSIFMTESVRKWAASYKEQLKKQNPSIDTYYALETKAISTKINSLDEQAGTSEILVKTQRQEFNNTLNNPRIFYQDILLKLIKVNNEWKVNGVYWQ